MSDRYNITIESYTKTSKPITKRIFYRSSFDDRFEIDYALEDYKGEFTPKAVAEHLLNNVDGMSDKWCQFQICDGLTELRVNKDKKTIERIDWNPDYDNKKKLR